MSEGDSLDTYWKRPWSNKLTSISDLLAERSSPTDHSVEEFVAGVLAKIREPSGELEFGDGMYEMANIRPDRSGLPFIVFISQKGNARHAARVKVAKGPRANEFFASVLIEPTPVVVAGDVEPDELSLLAEWIALNRDVLLGYWNGTIAYTEDALEALKPLPKTK